MFLTPLLDFRFELKEAFLQWKFAGCEYDSYSYKGEWFSNRTFNNPDSASSQPGINPEYAALRVAHNF
jgi:hypothetical protein